MIPANLTDLTPSRYPEALEWRLREFRHAAAPLMKAMANLHSIATPSYTVIFHSDGSVSNLTPRDDGMTPEMRLQMQWLQDQHAALARSYGFDVAGSVP